MTTSTSKTLYSERGNRLVAQHVDGMTKPIITMECYDKWYGVYMINVDGTVTSIDHGVINKVCAEKLHMVGVLNHCYHPLLLVKLAEHFDAEYCELSVELALGRWLLEINDCELEQVF